LLEYRFGSDWERDELGDLREGDVGDVGERVASVGVEGDSASASMASRYSASKNCSSVSHSTTVWPLTHLICKIDS
jgi:hypothetical protein